MSLKISTVTTKQGQHLSLGRFSVLVGPNNCGKSQTLRDIREFVTSGTNEKLTILSQVDAELPDKVRGIRSLRIMPHENPAHVRVKGVAPNLQSSEEWAPGTTWIDDAFADPVRQRTNLLKYLGRYWVAHLDAESRLRLASPTECYDTRSETPENALQVFFSELDVCQPELRKAFKQAFAVDIGLDWASMRRWYLRVGSDFGDLPSDRDGLDKIMSTSADLAQQGDGFRSFAGVVLGMLTCADRLLLLDEPEAFLHPAQARVLGRWLAGQASKADSQVIVATHNADFLWGIVDADVDATVIRLNRTSSGTSYHLIPPDATKGLLQTPLLSSQPVLDSFFQKGVAICEGDPDRALYQTVMHSDFASNGGDEILFVHTNGKDAIRIPAELMKRAGIPVCAIVDIDVMNSSDVLKPLADVFDRDLWGKIKASRDEIAAVVDSASESHLLDALVSALKKWLDEAHDDLRHARREVQALAKKASKWDDVKESGIRYFDENSIVIARELLSQCAEAGIFVVPVGSLESWIQLPATKGRRWNREALEVIRAKRTPEALKSFVGDVLHFLTRVP